MNTSSLKNFAQAARTQLLAQVSVQLDRALNAEGALRQEFATPIQALSEEIRRHGRERVVEEAAYLWFNRFVALRFMDVNDYADLRAVSPATEHDALPELLQLAKAGQLPDELRVNQQRLNDLLDGHLPSADPEGEVYRILLRAECNRRHSQLPFLFERIGDFSELLLPADLLSQQSILHQLRETLTPEVCQDNEEVIGWLYQFYISEKKDAVFAGKGKVKKEDIPAVTQLFTPRWIVEYMVQNTLGKLWLQTHPDSTLRDHMPYYLESPELDALTSATETSTTAITGDSHERSEHPQLPDYQIADADKRSFVSTTRLTGPQDLTLADQACGSGHILLYAFELLTRIYEESGYAAREISALILTHNLTGFEIDERAAQLAAFTLMMRARRYHRRALEQGLAPNIVRFQDLPPLSAEQTAQTFAQQNIAVSKELLHDLRLMAQATNFGSLIIPTATTDEILGVLTQVQSKLKSADLFNSNTLRELATALGQLAELSRRFWCVVNNPPYLVSTKLNTQVSKFIRTNYKEGKSDLFSAFMLRAVRSIHEFGYVGMITMQSWMFTKSFEKLRIKLLGDITFSSLIQIGKNSFPELNSKVAQACAFTFLKCENVDKEGIFIKLDEATDEINKEKVLSKKIRNKSYYYRNPMFFHRIPGSPIGFWVSDNIVKAYSQKRIDDNHNVKEGVGTRNDEKFLRFHWEVTNSTIGRDKKWIKTDKAGGAFKWYNYYEYILFWENDGHEIRNYRNPDGSLKSRPQNTQYFYKDAISWSKVTSGAKAFRYRSEDYGFNDAALSIFGPDLYRLLGLLNSSIVDKLLEIKVGTVHLPINIVKELPTLDSVDPEALTLVSVCVELSKLMMRYDETHIENHGQGYNFSYSHISRLIQDLSTSFGKNFLQLHYNEEKINKLYTEAFGIFDVSIHVSLKRLSVLKSELDSKALAKTNKKLKRDPTTGLVTNYDELELPFKRDVIMQQFISYAVGCMLGRYSLDKEGLILANAGDTLREYAEKVGKGAADWTFAPDEDGILPVLAGEYFPDDIVGRFRVFLRAAFGEEHFVENLAFVEECIGKDIRSYFVRDFYKDHVQRYKKRPIYWMFQSPGKHFRALVYLHRYRPDTVGRLLNDYLRPFIDRLTTERGNAQAVVDDAGSSAAARASATKTIEYANQALRDCEAYQKDLLELARRRIDLDLDDGVLVNYNKMGDAVEVITGVNDAKGRKKVRGFDWVEWEW